MRIRNRSIHPLTPRRMATSESTSSSVVDGQKLHQVLKHFADASVNQWRFRRRIARNFRSEVKASTPRLQSPETGRMASSLAMSPLGYRIEGKSGGWTVFVGYFVARFRVGGIG
jgi:hypothetical protein